MKIPFGILLAFCSLVLLPSCGPAEQKTESEPDAQKLRFVFITCVVHEDFFIPVKKGMEDAAQMMGVACSFTGTEGVDIPAQVEMVRQAIRDKYDGIVLNIIDPEEFDAVIKEAADAGIPLLGFNIDDHQTPNQRLSSVNQRLYEAGKSLGKEAARFIPDGSEILMTMHDEGVSALDDRLKGAQDGLREAGKTDVTWKVAITGNAVQESTHAITELLQAHPHINIVLCTGQADTEGAGNAIATHFAGKGYQAAGFDLSPSILQNILEGHLAFTIDQQPYMQGFFPVIQLALLKRYGIIPTDMDTGAALITAANAQSVMELSKKHYR